MSNCNIHHVSWPWRDKGLKLPHQRKKDLRNKNHSLVQKIVEKSERFWIKMALEINISSIKYISQPDHVLCSKRPITLRVNPRALWEKLLKKDVRCNSEGEGRYAPTTSRKEICSVTSKEKNPGLQEDFSEDISTQGVSSHEFDMELRESTVATRCSVPNLHGVYSTNFTPNLKARYKMSSFHFCERCLHSTADVDTIQT